MMTIASVTVAPQGEAASKADERLAAARRVAVAAAPEPTAWDHNISGVTQFGGTEDALKPLMLRIQESVQRGGLPVVVSIQEACLVQMTALRDYLKANVHGAFTMHTYFARPDVCLGYGSAVYVLAGTNAGAQQFTAQGAPYDGDTRGWVCARSGLGYTACTAHLICPVSCVNRDDPNGSAKAREIRMHQFQEYYSKIRQQIQVTGQPVYWGGDFYISPSQMPTGVIRTNREADECETPTNWQNTQDSGQGKVDWLFLTEPAASPCPHDAYVQEANVPGRGNQDHHILASYHRPAEGGQCNPHDTFLEGFVCSSINRTPGHLEAVGTIDDHTSGSDPVAIQVFLEVNNKGTWRLAASTARRTGTDNLIATINAPCPAGSTFRSKVNWNWNNGATRGTIYSKDVVC